MVEARRWAGSLLVLLLLAVPAASAAPYLQHQVDASRSGASSDPGPVDHIHRQTIDEAFAVQLPGLRAFAAPPLILDGAVYVLTGTPGPMARPVTLFSQPAPPAELGALGIHRVDLDTTEVDEVATFETPPTSWASDGERFFVATQTGIAAYPVDGGQPLWTWSFPEMDTGAADSTVCAPLAVDGAQIYAACTQFSGDGASSFAAGAQRTFVVALRSAGEQSWIWMNQDDALDEFQQRGYTVWPGVEASRLAVAGSVLAVSFAMTSRTDYTPPTVNGVVVLDRGTGEFLWSAAQDMFDGQSQESPEVLVHMPASGLVGTPEALYIRGQILDARDPVSGNSLWTRDLESSDQAVDNPQAPFMRWAGHVLGLWGATLYTMERDHQYALDTTARGEILWETSSGGHPEDAGGLLMTRDVFYLANWFQKLWGYDRETGALAVEQRLARDPFSRDTADGFVPAGEYPVPVDHRILIGVGDGVLAAAVWDGNMTVFGRTGASIQPNLDVSNRLPGPGEAVQVDLSATQPGALDTGLEFRADWGNGTIDDWQDDPVFEHAYDSAGEQEALFQIRNPAGQRSTEVVTFDVGATPPEQAGFIETAFARENQDMTFGVLGILLAIGGTIVGVAARRRHEAAEADRLAAYEQALVRELDDGRSPEEATERLASQRALLGISEKEHARLLESLGAQRSGVAVALVPGERFLGRYDVIERIGVGGGGAAYLCEDAHISRTVVIKALRTAPETGGPETLVREAQAFGAVNHENVVTLHDIEQVGDRVFLVMEHVAGGSLDEAGEVAFEAVADDLLSALAAVHDAGVVHRDVKPSNVLVTADGRFKLADFGIAHLPDYETTIAGLGGGTAVGTVRYMSPEQARGRAVDHRSDLYSAAVVLWEALAGEAYMASEPGETATELQMRVAQADGLPRVPDDAPDELAAWFEKSLDPDPEERFQSAEGMLEAFERRS